MRKININASSPAVLSGGFLLADAAVAAAGGVVAVAEDNDSTRYARVQPHEAQPPALLSTWPPLLRIGDEHCLKGVEGRRRLLLCLAGNEQAVNNIIESLTQTLVELSIVNVLYHSLLRECNVFWYTST